MADNVDESTQTVEEVRTKLVNGVLLVLAFLMVPTATLSWLRIYTVGFQPIMVLHTTVGLQDDTEVQGNAPVGHSSLRQGIHVFRTTTLSLF